MMKNHGPKKNEQKQYFNISIPGGHGDPAGDAITTDSKANRRTISFCISTLCTAGALQKSEKK